MRHARSRSLAAGLLLAAVGACAARARHADAFVGGWRASAALGGGSTYTGTLELSAAGADSVRGTMRFTSPFQIDVTLAGVAGRDSLRLAGGYAGANGCTGELRTTLPRAAATSVGPFEIKDSCAGTRAGTLTVTR
jgi:hypothetical protein